jgi:hypothetical protein
MMSSGRTSAPKRRVARSATSLCCSFQVPRLERVAEVPTHPLTHLFSIRDRGLEVVELRIPDESTTVGKPVKALSLPPESILSLIIRKDSKPIVPTPDTVMKINSPRISPFRRNRLPCIRTCSLPVKILFSPLIMVFS